MYTTIRNAYTPVERAHRQADTRFVWTPAGTPETAAETPDRDAQTPEPSLEWLEPLTEDYVTVEDSVSTEQIESDEPDDPSGATDFHPFGCDWVPIPTVLAFPAPSASNAT